MAYMSVTAGQMGSAAGYLTRNWGDCGYRFTGIESPTHAVSVFRVVCSDGGRFAIVADKWGNCSHFDTHDGDKGLAEVIREMHVKAVQR